MPTALESRDALKLVTGEAVGMSLELLRRVKGSPDARRLALLDGVPGLIDYYADGSAALAADFYEESRELAGVRTAFATEPVVLDRTVKIRRAIAWSAEPMFGVIEGDVAGRLAEVVQLETARPFRDTITANRRRDPASVGWRRVTVGGCRFCRMLADRGAVYRESTARFAAHTHCSCTAEPVFGPNDTGETASVMQYTASRRNRTAAQKADLRDYLNTFYSDFPG